MQLKIPDEIRVSLSNSHLSLKGPLGRIDLLLERLDPKSVVFLSDENVLTTMNGYRPYEQNIQSVLEKSFTGLLQGYLVQLELIGVGFRVDQKDQTLEFKLGYSHSIYYELPSDVRAIITKPTELTLYGVDYGRVTQIAAKIKQLRPPELYKGKGIRRSSDVLYLKERK